MALPPSLHATIQRQWGAVALRQAPGHGLSVRSLRHTAAVEAWPDPFPGFGVRLHPASADTFQRQVTAALLAVGDHASASRWSALHLHGLTRRPPRRIELLVPYGRGAPELGPRVHVWRSRTVVEGDLSTPHGIPATGIARTVCDLAAVTRPRTLRNVLIDARQRRLVTLDTVLEQARRMAGTTGLPTLRMVCWQLDRSRCDSVLAEWIREEMVRAGLEPDPGEIPVTASNGVTLHIDVGFRSYRVGVEAEGLGAHADRADLERDARRRNTLRLTDWRIVWVTWERMETDRDGVIAEVVQELRRRGFAG